jgi:hypothetical protein
MTNREIAESWLEPSHRQELPVPFSDKLEYPAGPNCLPHHEQLAGSAQILPTEKRKKDCPLHKAAEAGHSQAQIGY